MRTRERAKGGVCEQCADEHGTLAGIACGVMHPRRHVAGHLANARTEADRAAIVDTLLAARAAHPNADWLALVLYANGWMAEVWTDGRAIVHRPSALERANARELGATLAPAGA